MSGSKLGVIRRLDVREVTVNTTMEANTSYIANSSSQIVFTLPDVFNVGDEFIIMGKGSGGWKLQTNGAASKQRIAEGQYYGSYSSNSNMLICQSLKFLDCVTLRAIEKDTLVVANKNGSQSMVTLLTDDFTRANSSTIGNGWSQLVINGSIQISSNQVYFYGTTPNGAISAIYRNDISFDTTLIPCWIQFKARRTTNNYAGRFACIFGASGNFVDNLESSASGLAFWSNNGDSAFNLRDNSGHLTSFGSGVTVSDDTYRMELISTTRVKIYKNGSLLIDYTKGSPFSFTSNYIKFQVDAAANVQLYLDEIIIQAGLYI